MLAFVITVLLFLHDQEEEAKPGVAKIVTATGTVDGAGTAARSPYVAAVLREFVDAKDRYGFTPLMCAASLGSDTFGDAPSTLCRCVAIIDANDATSKVVAIISTL